MLLHADYVANNNSAKYHNLDFYDVLFGNLIADNDANYDDDCYNHLNNLCNLVRHFYSNDEPYHDF